MDIQDGVLLDQNSTGLGNDNNVVVDAGTALELANGVATENGGIAAGIQLGSSHLVLNGTGNTTFGDPSPLVILSQDEPLTGTNTMTGPISDPIVPTQDLWNGDVSLNTSMTVTFQAVPQYINLSGAKGGKTPTEFTLTFNGLTTGNLTYTGVGTTDAATIQTALNNLSTISGFTINGQSPGSVTVAANSTDNLFTVAFNGSLAGTTDQLTGTVTQTTATISVSSPTLTANLAKSHGHQPEHRRYHDD